MKKLKHGNMKLTDLDIRCIHFWLSAGYRQVDIAKAFGMSQAHVSLIKRGRARVGGADVQSKV